jgi:hypothetical protein
MAYDARGRELNEFVDKLPNLEEKVRRALKDFVEDYVIERARCFDDLLVVLEKEDQDHGDWRDRVGRTRSELSNYVAAALSTIGNPLAEEVRTFLSITNVQEDSFLNRLQDAAAAHRRDNIVKLRKTLEQMTKDLDQKWTDLLSRNRPFADGEKSSVEDIEKIIDEAVRTIAERDGTIHEKLAAATDKVGDNAEKAGSVAEVLAQLVEALEAVSEAMKIFTGWFGPAKANLEARVLTYKSLLQTQMDTIFYVFHDIRDDVDDFLEDNGLDEAKEEYEYAANLLRDLASSTSTSAQRSDVDEFVPKALQKLDSAMHAMETVFQSFYSKWEGSFHGSVDDKVKEAFLQIAWWRDKIDDVEDKRDGLMGRLREVQSRVGKMWDVDLSALPDEARTKLKSYLARDIEDLLRSIEEMSRQAEALDEALGRSAAEDKLEG